MSTPDVSTPSPVESTPSQPALSEFERIAKTFYEPSKTFADIPRSAAWWGPFILVAIFWIAFAIAVDKKIGFEQIFENEMRNNPKAAEQMEKMPAEQQAQMRQMQISGVRVSMYMGPVFLLVVALIAAAVYMATCNFGLGTEMKYKQVVAIVMYSSLPAIFTFVLAILVLFAGADPEGFNVRAVVATTPAFFLSPVESPVLYAMGQQIEIFRIWGAVLTAIGLSVVGRIKQSTAMWVVFGWYAILVLGAGAIAAAFN